ncbi:5'-methylthioadenosine/adenosylhomocysteine nucleosidase [Porphyromonas circumdentaria]|uniref:5'-methylthioadenosine/adenosylhomocysteine nucleosidase n=1 Tax=Porphyromonas circumdentaria TaxID=29524 RepID=UPI0026DAAC02|nr:5'-methylthioadenosine/adenosylhomocysteine nucleosidase [Porphyromonas circumdentaria]MDO4721928.1 5'-methylthioadenosine/adenosylhomocysteine nucleosidase [Porphyromonas circumdentaria]
MAHTLSTSIKTLALIVAMPKEALRIASFFQETEKIAEKGLTASVGYKEGVKIILALSGIGKVAAAITTAEVIRRYAPNGIINIGVSGGIHESTHQGDLVVANQVCYHDVFCGEEIAWGQVQGFPLYYPSSMTLLSQFKKTNIPYHTGLAVCGDRFLTDPEEFDFIRKTFPQALSIDMESAAVAQTCYVYHTPFAIIRAISDTPGRGDSYQQYTQFWEEEALQQKVFNPIQQLLNSIIQ